MRLQKELFFKPVVTANRYPFTLHPQVCQSAPFTSAFVFAPNFALNIDPRNHIYQNHCGMLCYVNLCKKISRISINHCFKHLRYAEIKRTVTQLASTFQLTEYDDAFSALAQSFKCLATVSIVPIVLVLLPS